MMKTKWIVVSLWAALLLGLVIAPVSAGDVVLSNSTGTASTVWFIRGEPSLVINGFDLTPLNVQLPAVIDRVSISVETPTPGVPVDVVVYQDGNGGSPVDATLIGQSQVDITQSGVFTAVFDTPVQVTQPVVWVGFYLPVDFEFLADTSGTSVLTYWAWKNGGRFNIGSLSSADVLGPADGTAPVSINMNGKARIMAEISTDRDSDRVPDTRDNCDTVANPSQADNNGDGTGNACDPTNPTGPEVVPVVTAFVQPALVGGANFSVMRPYDGCPTLLRDIADIEVSLHDSIDGHCQEIWIGYAPPAPSGYERKHALFDIAFYNDRGVIPNELQIEVTHCILLNEGDRPNQQAVMGVAHGSPRAWQILPSQRFGDFICAEVPRGGNLSYFVPIAAPAPAATPAS